MVKSLLTLCSLLIALNLLAYDKSVEETDSIGHHNHPKNEIAVSNSPVYFIKEKIFAYGLHMHYVRSIAETKYGVGLCYERTFGSHGHNTAGLVAAWMPVERLNLSLSPSLSFEDDHPKAQFALHFDSSYDYELGCFHVGPGFELAYDPEDWHISIGLHVGYAF
jgi:hypothetical protein